MRTKKEYRHLGNFLIDTMKKLKITKRAFCSDTHSGSSTYARLRKGENLLICYYISFLNLLWDVTTEEEFREHCNRMIDCFVEHKKRQESGVGLG